jgi:NADH pyrophosphatase NudC (nudix superfamily)
MIVMTAGICVEPRSDAFWQLTGSLCLVAIAATHASMMALARLGPRVQWVRSAALAVNVLLVAMALAAIWQVTRGDTATELLAILAIIEAGLTLAITAISAASRGSVGGEGVAEICFCPRCGKRLWLPAGEIRCRHCDEVFFVELRPAGELPGAILRG